MAIADKLIALNTTKQAIKTAIENKGQDTTAVPFTDYPTLIQELGEPKNPDWVRNPLWVQIPEVIPNEQVIYLLIAVTENKLFTLNMLGTNMVVDWGDGTIENVPNHWGVLPFFGHQYDINNPLLTDTVNELGYKQALIKISVLEGGSIDRLQIQRDRAYASPFSESMLDAVVNAKNLIFLELSGYWIQQGMLERVKILENNLTNVASLSTAYNLKKFEMDFSNLTSINALFSNCQKLVYVGDENEVINLENCLTAISAFSGARSLKKIKTFNAPVLEDASNIFNGSGVASVNSDTNDIILNLPNLKKGEGICRALINEVRNVELTTSELLNNIAYILEFTTFDNLTISNTSQLSNWTRALAGSMSEKFPILDTSNGGIFTQFCMGATFEGKANYDFSNATMLQSAFSQCRYMIEINDLNLPNTLHADNIFNGSGLLKAPEINAPNITNFDAIFENCNAINSITIDLTNAVTVGNAFRNMLKLKALNIIGLSVSINLRNSGLEASAINQVFNDLLPVTTAQTITITGSVGASQCDPTIATAKGWTVVQ